MTKQDCQVGEKFLEMQKEEKKNSKKGLCNSTISPIYCPNPFISCTGSPKGHYNVLQTFFTDPCS